MARRHRVLTETEIDLTPMIDVIFQLIIFFMVVTQITTQENVNLRLPDALTANEEDPQVKKMFTVHIAATDQGTADKDLPAEFGWFCKGEARARSVDEMKAILQQEASLVDPDSERTGLDDNNISQNMIYIRCDARAPTEHFSRLLELMVEARMYKIKVGIMKDQLVD
jgi:biopolymer transport protein ExbD